MSRSSFISILLIILFGLLALAPSFKLGFSGDDWLAFYRYRYHLGDWTHHEFTHVSYFLTPYGSQDIIMGLLQKIFDYVPKYYYYVSFFLRISVSIILYRFINSFSKNKIAGLCSGIFFAITTIGIDTTNWVFNMPSYISLALFLVLIYIFIQSQIKNSYKLALLCAPLYYLTFVFAPIRMHGLPMILTALELFLLIKSPNWSTLKLTLTRQILLIGTLALIRITGKSMGVSAIGDLVKSLTLIIEMLKAGDFAFVATPFVIVGRFFVPENVWPIVQAYFPNPTIRHIVPFSILFFSPLYLFFWHLECATFKSKKYSLFLLGLLLAVTFVFYSLAKVNVTNLVFANVLGPALLGGYFFVFCLTLLVKYFKENVTYLIFLSVFWTFLSFVYPFFLSPLSLLNQMHRYLIIPALGMAIFWGMLMILAKVSKLKIHLSVVIMFFLSIQFFSTRAYLNNLVSIRSAQLANRIWSLMPKFEGLGSGSEPKVFYFEGDSEIIYHSITFGFPPHMAMLYNYNETQAKLPVPLSSWNDVMTTVTTGKNMPAYGYPIKPISIENIYAFKITATEVTDVTSEKQVLLKKLLLDQSIQTKP